jgi:hypothetical protein
MKRLGLIAAVLAVALAACTGVGRLMKCSFDCAFPDEPDAGAAEQPACAKSRRNRAVPGVTAWGLWRWGTAADTRARRSSSHNPQHGVSQ